MGSATIHLNDDEFREHVERNRDIPSRDLRFRPNLSRLLDPTACKQLDADLYPCGSAWERLVAAEGIESQIPKERGLYMFVWIPKLPLKCTGSGVMEQGMPWVLYVGKAGVKGGTSDTLRNRFNDYKKHIGKSPASVWSTDSADLTREERLATYLTLRPLEYWYIRIGDAELIDSIEKRLRYFLRPPINTQTEPSMRLTATGPAF